MNSGWSVTAGGRGISLPTQAYPPATFPKALMVLLKTYLTLPSRTLCSRGVLARTTCREGEMVLCANYIRLMLLFPPVLVLKACLNIDSLIVTHELAFRVDHPPNAHCWFKHNFYSLTTCACCTCTCFAS